MNLVVQKNELTSKTISCYLNSNIFEIMPYDGRVQNLCKKFFAINGDCSDTNLIDKIKEFIDLGIAVNSKAVRKCALKCYFKLFYKGNYEAIGRVEAIFNEIKLPKKNSKSCNRDMVLTKEDLKNYKELVSDGIITKKEDAIFSLLVETGMRVSEACTLLKSNIKPTRTEGVFKAKILGKGNKEREIFLTEEILSKVEKYVKTKNGNALKAKSENKLLCIDRRSVWQIIHDTGVKMSVHISPHSLRHTFATISLANNEPMAKVSKYLGHSSINVTAMIYDHNEFIAEDFKQKSIL